MSSSSTPEAPLTSHDGLRQLLGAFDLTKFLNEFLGEQMLHLTGEPGRGADLFSWEALNALLNRDSWSPPHVRLVRRGQMVKSALYMQEHGGRTTLDPVRCQQQMARGATLIVQLPKGISQPLDALLTALKQELNAEAYADIVVTSAAVPGLNMHWDPYECFNIQLAGRKEWQVIRPARAYPLRQTKYFPQRGDLVEPKVPDGPPTWVGVMQPGDLIYLPRGWWHGVTPRTLPCMHLSIAVDIPTLSDFFTWCTQNLKQHDAARRPIPSWRTDDARNSSIRDALALMTNLISADTLDAFIAHTMNGAPRSVPFTLPASALASPSVLTQAAKLQLQRRPLPHRVIDGQLRLEWAGETLEFSASVLPIVERLNESRTITFAALSEGCNALLVRAFVLSLLSAGIVSIVDDVS